MSGLIKKKPAVVLPFPQQPPQPLPKPVEGLSRFEIAVRYVMENEDGVSYDHDRGTFTNDPRDPGGATIWGIIKTEYETYLGRDLSISEVKAMPRETALAIYLKNFWNVIHGDSYSSTAASTAIFDTAVNKGLGGCMVILTDALHQHFEERYGSDLIAAVNSMSAKDFLAVHEAATLRYIESRIQKFPNMEWARKGWNNRAVRLLTLAQLPS